MREATDEQVDTLLLRMHEAARAANIYYGLPLWGDHSRRPVMREIVREWLIEQKRDER